MKELNVKDLEQVTGGDGAFTEIGRAIDNIVGAVGDGARAFWDSLWH
ncbi:TPA: bacteriocin [Neisseria oralis]|jgi:hypothetical protein